EKRRGAKSYPDWAPFLTAENTANAKRVSANFANERDLNVRVFEPLKFRAKFGQCFAFNLSHAFAGHSKLLAHFFQSLFAFAIQPKPRADYGGFACCQGFDEFAKPGFHPFFFDSPLGSIRIFILDDVRERA